MECEEIRAITKVIKVEFVSIGLRDYEESYEEIEYLHFHFHFLFCFWEVIEVNKKD
ncbi:hypothetical protein AALP_AA4G031300 [Arabis alpina]|uniref:Uncharacterized protein n=1 Tax=Arabis alpina TaxID=50452 RepID=A0A087H0U6_ARAAL|nr:hypothetical protein AALP_AA4G031300 [Arabis alpina]